MKKGEKFIDKYHVVWKILRFNVYGIPILWSKGYGEGLWNNGTGLSIF